MGTFITNCKSLCDWLALSDSIFDWLIVHLASISLKTCLKTANKNRWWMVKSIFVIPHAASKTFIQLTGHVWLWETPENCFFSVLFVMSRSVSFLTIVCLVADSFIQSRDETYYNKVFRNRDCIPLTGACWILGFAVAISPFSSSRN